MEKIGYLILLLFIILIAFLPYENKNSKIKKYCRIDSIIVDQRYQTLPDLTFKYYTPCGVFTFINESVEIVGDSLEINLIINE
jgi:hypothetical protein